MAYLPLKCAGRRNFLISSLNTPQHPLIQLAMLVLSSFHYIFVCFYGEILIICVAHDWFKSTLPRRPCRPSISRKTK